MIGPIAPGGPRGNLRLRLLLRFAEGPMGEAASTGSDAQVLATAAAAARLRLQLLNLPCLVLASGSAHVLERKDAALLAMLAVEGPTPRNKAAALLWPDIDEERARNSLRQRLFRLRRLAGGDVVRAGQMLALADDVRHDLEALGPRLLNDPDAATGALLGELDYGDCLELSEWVGVARDQWRTARCNALAEIAARLEADGRIAPALAYAQRLTAEDPTLEHAHRRVMRLHYLRGDRGAALAAFERCRELLRQHVGAQPGKETLELARLIEASGALPQPAPAAKSVAILRPPRLVGREREWQLLEQSCDSLRAFVVAGDPGMGKTRLLADFAQAHGNALVVGSRPGDARVPYATLAALLRALVRRHGAPADDWVGAELAHVLPELGESSAKFEPLRLRMAAARAVEQWHEAGLRIVALDDLHFADEATLEVLPALAMAADVPVFWLFGVRANELPAAVDAWLAQQDAGTHAHVTLAPLDEPAVRELLDTLALPGIDPTALAPALARHAGGNPLFVLETLRALVAQGAVRVDPSLKLPAPASVGDLIERRLQQLSPDALKLARVAAIAGPDFNAELAAVVLGKHTLDIADAWLELETAQIIRGNAFAHDLIFESTLRSVPQQIARVMHRAIAQHLERSGAAIARVAEHWYEANEWQRAALAFAAAADSAKRASRRNVELALLERAATCLERSGDQATRFEVGLRTVAAMRAVRPQNEAELAARWLVQIAASDRQAAQARRDLGACLMNSVRWDAAATELSAARELAARSADSDLENHCRYLLALATAYTRGLSSAIDEFSRLASWAETQPDAELRHAFLADYGIALEQGDRRREAIRHLSRALDYFVEHGCRADACETRMMLARAQLCLGHPRLARELLEIAVRERKELSAGSGGHSIEALNLGRTYIELGMYRQALDLLESARDRLATADVKVMLGAVESALGRLYLTLGQPARALRSMRELALETPLHQRAARLWVEALLTDGPAERGRKLRQAVAQFTPGADLPFVRVPIELDSSLSLDAPDARALCERIMDESIERELPGATLHAKVRLAQAYLRLGESIKAGAMAAEFLNDLRDTQPALFYVPEAWWVAYSAFTAAARNDDALSALEHGAHWITRVALPNVPSEFHGSFLDRNPINRAILTTASRLRKSPPPAADC